MTDLPPFDADAADATLTLAADLIACRSVTPDDGGAIDVIAARLERQGFVCERLDRGHVRNLWARHGTATPVICFAGHVDVVPPGPLDAWISDPFEPVQRDGYLYGRGASDMKGPLAAMVTAAERLVSGPLAGSVGLIITSDEEGDAVDGTAHVVDVLQSRGIHLDAVIVGEPTSEERLGDTVKHGRRGSLSGDLVVHGIQCHIAYPERGRNPVMQALPALTELAATRWDDGADGFPATSFQISNVRAGTGASNVIPGLLEVAFNFRFSPASTAADLQERVAAVLDRHGLDYALTWRPIAHPFYTPEGRLVDVARVALRAETSQEPLLSTGGGTSDGRFLATLAGEVVEVGPPNDTIHKVNERVRIDDLASLTRIYERIVRAYLGA
jgi:succinyl-diaminopimelate desuccinylase